MHRGGGEFRNGVMEEVAAKHDISFHLTAGNSPWSNGKNERSHYTVDRTIEKRMEEDPSLSLEEALSHTLYVYNLQITKRGFSPRQLMFGTQAPWVQNRLFVTPYVQIVDKK